ncbi:MAG: hypothetical protein JXA41_10155 [Deltaproteobacteria bacterium]|nr:hypothetical protein [Deltaproteobacteria bacterium]
MAEKKHHYDLNCRYFLKAGAINTKSVLEVAAKRAQELSVKNVLVATCSGKTAISARNVFLEEIKIIAVTHVAGFLKPDYQELSDEERQRLASRHVTIFTGQHAFGGVGRGVRKKLGTYQVDEIMAYTLRTFGQGTKVAIELALMATDAGLIRTDENVISIGGTAHGADTALVIKPANSANFFDLKVREVICKPAVF